LLPKDYSPLGIYYNKKIFDEFGVDYPQDGWTWDEFLATAQALTQDTDGDGKTDVWGIQLPGPWTTGFEYWVAAAGGRLISEDGQSFVGYMDSPETAAAVQFYADLYNEYEVAPPPADMNVFGGGNNEFDNGQAAMRIFGRWPQSGLRENPNIDLGVVGPPQQAERANVLFWGGFGIHQGTENPEAAWLWLVFLSEKIPQNLIPARRSLAESKEFQDQIGSDVADAVYKSMQSVTLISPELFQFGDSLEYFSQAIDDIVNGTASAQEALDWAQDQIESP